MVKGKVNWSLSADMNQRVHCVSQPQGPSFPSYSGCTVWQTGMTVYLENQQNGNRKKLTYRKQ